MEERLGKTNILEIESIPKLLRKFAVPSVISLLVNALYNIVDQIFIGRGVGYLGNGATNVILPLVVMNMALCMLFGDGAATFFSVKLGEKKEDQACHAVGNAIVCGIITGIITCTVFNIGLQFFCRLTGATDNIMPYALEYGHIIISAFPAVALIVVTGSIIRADGRPRFTMAGLLVGCGINVILDYLFVIRFQWGVKGAAWATVIGELANAVMFFCYLFHFKCIRLHKKAFQLNKIYVLQIMKLGISSFATQLSAVLIMIVMNRLLVFYGRASIYGEVSPMTAMGVTMKINQILLSLMTGIAAGALPIIGFNYGARKYKRVKQTIRLTIISAMLCGVIATFFFQICPEQIVSIFGSESTLYVDFSVKCLKVYLLFCILDGLNNVIPTCLQAIEKPGLAVLTSLLRQIIFNLPPAFLAPIFLGVAGVLWNGPIASVAACVLNIFILKYIWKQMKE